MPIQPSPAAVDGLFFECDANRILQQQAARAGWCLYVCEILTLREFVTGHFDMSMCICVLVVGYRCIVVESTLNGYVDVSLSLSLSPVQPDAANHVIQISKYI